MEPATAKLSGHEPGPKLTPFASRRENHEGAAADSESIPIRAPLSKDVDDDEEKEGFGTEESESESVDEEEEAFQITTVESPVGSFTARNPTFLYGRQGSRRRTNGNGSFSVDEMEGVKAAHERGISAEDEAVMEEFVPLVAMVREASSSPSPSPSPSSAAAGFSLIRPVAKPSGDDDEQPPEDLENENLGSEEERDSCNVARVPPFAFSGGLHVVGEFGDVGAVEEQGMDDGGFRIVKGSVETVENMKGYGEATTETSCPELAVAKFGDTIEERGRKGSEEAVIGKTADVQNLGPATHVGAFGESEWKEQVGGDRGFQVEEDKVLTNAKKGDLKDSSNEPRVNVSAEIETKVLADAGEGVLDDSNDKQQEAVSAEIETKVHADAKESVLKDANDKQQEIANAAIGNEILANDAGGVLKDSNDKQQEVASAEAKTEVLPDAEEGVLDDSNDKQQEAVSAEIETKVHADAKEAVLKDTNDKQKEIANAAIGNEILANDAGGVLKDSNDKQQEVASAEIEIEVLADAGEGVLDDSNDKQQEAVGAEIETKIHADAKEAVLKDSNDKQKEIANAAIGNEILSNDAGGVLKDSNDKQQEVASAEIETEVHADAEEGVLKDSNDKQQEVVTPEIETEVLTDAKEGVLKDSTDRQQEIASAEIESDVLVNAKEGVLKDSDDKQQEIASTEIESEVLANAKEGVLKDSNDKQKKTANAAIENEILANGAGGSLNDSNNKQQEVARAEIETEILTDAEGGVLKNSNDKQQEVASPEIKTEVLTDVKEGVLRDSNDGQQKIDCAVIENEVLANAAGSILKDSDNKQQEIAKAEIESDFLVNAKENVLKDSIETQQEIANAEIESEVHANVKECVSKDSNDMQQQITDAAIENEILSNGVGGVLKDSNNKQQEVASAEIETEVLADAEEGVLKDSNDKQQEVASPEIGTEVLTDAKEGALKDSNDRQQEIASVAIENEVLANAAGGVLKDSNNKQQGIANAEIKSDVLVNAKEGVLNDSNDKQQEIANAEIESEVLVNAKEGDLKDSNDKQQEVAKAEIVDAEKVVDGDTLSAVNSEQDGITRQELAGTQKETRGIEDVKHEGICNKDTVDTNNATDVAASLDNDLVEDGMVEQEVIKNEKEVDDMGKCKADGIQEAKAVNAQGVTKEIPLHESESMREHVAESKQEGTDKDGSQLEREWMDEEDIVNTSKLQGDGALLDSDSNEDWVTEEDIHDSRKEGLDDKQIEGDDLLEEAKVAHFQSTSKEWILEDSNVKQEGADKGGDSQERRANETHQTNVAKIQAGKEGASDDFESKQKVISFEERDNTQKTEADDKREAKAAENKTVKGLDFANMTSREGTKFNLESQSCQGSGQLKEGVEFSQREMLGSLKPKKDTESEVPATNADVSEKSTLGKVDRNPEMKTNFSISKDEYMEEKYVVEEEPVATDAKPQFKFESSTGSDQSIQNVVGRMVADWEEEADDDDDEDDDEDEEMMDTSALAALMEAASSAGTVSNNPSVGAAGFSVSTRPAGLGSSVSLLNPIPRYLQHSRTNESAFSRSSALVEDNQDNTDSADGYDETQEKLQTIRVKFLRLVKRLDQSPQNVVVTQVLYRLGLAEGLKRGRSTNRAVSLDRSSKIAEELEAAGQEDLDFTCNILVLGKTGVGKSATINSIFDEVKSATNAFWPATNKVQEILGTIHGIKVRVVDTPGLMPSFADRHRNKAIMSSVKKFIRKCPPDIVLYFDRLDVQSRDYSDLPLLKIITETFGAAIWFNAIVVLTHASSAPPDGANGTPLSYEMFMAQRSQIVQHSIRQAAGDMRLMNPVSLVENHLLCRKNRAGQSVLPNGQVWKPQLLLLCFSSKVLAEANAILKLQDSTPGKPFGFRTRAPPLPFLLSSLLQSRAQLKVPDEQTGEEIDSDEDLDQLSDSDDEDEYDRLPPFKPLSKYRLSKLSKEQRKAYLDEIDYREKLYQKKQWKEELRRRRNIKKTRGTYKVESDRVDENFEEDITGAAAVAVPMPDMAMPPAFDSDNPTYRYRYLETADQWLVRPVLDTHGWDHDIGYDGVNVEKMLVIGNKVPASISGQITKDKKEANLQLECVASLKHGEHKVTQAGFDVQTVGKGLAYTLRSETRFSNFKCNKTTGGLALTYLGDTLVTGMKLEDRIMIGKRSKFVVNGGAMMGGGHLAYGGSLEASLRDKDYPIGQTLTTLGLSVMNWHGDFAIGGNLQSQFGIGRKMMMVTRANLNNKGSGQISIRTSSSEQLQIALIGIIPVIRALIGGRLFGPDSTQ